MIQMEECIELKNGILVIRRLKKWRTFDPKSLAVVH